MKFNKSENLKEYKEQCQITSRLLGVRQLETKDRKRIHKALLWGKS